MHSSELLAQPWFMAINLVGIIAFAISGVVIARNEHYSIFGCLVLGLLGMSGGLMRDLVLGRHPPAILQGPIFVLTIITTVAVSVTFLKCVDFVRGRSLLFFDLVHWYVVWSKRLPPAMLLIIFDAIGLGSYTVVGVLVAFHMGTAPFLLWGPIFGVVSSCGGGILRDMLRAQAHIAKLKSEIYPEISLVWGGIYSLIISWIDVGGYLPPVSVTLSGIAVMIGIFATRMIFVQTRLRPPLVGPRE